MWKPNRRFLRDIRQLVSQGHDISYERDERGRYWFIANGGERLSPDDINVAAVQWRKPITLDAFEKAKIRANEIWKSIKWESAE